MTAHHHPPLNSLIHPHVHTILHLAQEYSLPTPTWTSTIPDEKRSVSSDKTITPSTTIKTPKATLQANPSSGTTSIKRNDTSDTIVPTSLMAQFVDEVKIESSSSNKEEHGQAQGPMLSTSPAADKSQQDWRVSSPVPSSSTSNPNANQRTQTTTPATNGTRTTKTENELWIEIADALTVVADGLKQEQLRSPLGGTSLIIHVLVLLSLSVTYDHEAKSTSERQGGQPTNGIEGLVLAQIQCLRTLANLCIDNDDNRSHLLLHDTPLFVLTLVKRTLEKDKGASSFNQNTLTLLKTAMGALLNLQLDHTPSRAWLLRLPKPRRNHHPHEQGGHRSHDHSGHDHPHHHPHRSVSHHRHQQHPNHEHRVGSPAHTHHHTISQSDQASSYVANSPFELEESDTLKILLAVATDSRIYTPSVGLHSLLGPRVGEFEAEDFLEDEGDGEDQVEWTPPHNRWSEVELGAQVSAWSVRIMEDLLAYETDEVRAAQEQDQGEQIEASHLPSLSRSALASDEDTWDRLLQTLLFFVPTRNKFRSYPNQEPVMKGEHKPFHRSEIIDPPEDVSALLDADLSLLWLCGELLEGCSHVSKGQDANATKFKQRGLDKLKDLLDFLEKGTSPLGTNTSPPQSLLERFGLDTEDITSLSRELTKSKNHTMKTIIAVVSEDVNTSQLFSAENDFLNRMINWLQLSHSLNQDEGDNVREDLISCSILCLANLARNDSNCISLVYDYNILDQLLNILSQQQSQRQDPQRGTGSMLLTHGIVGLIKNLSIPLKNKVRIGKSGVFAQLGQFLDKKYDFAQPIQFSTIGITKHLSFVSQQQQQPKSEEDVGLSVLDNAIQICDEHDGILGALLDLIERTDDMPSRLEATRVLVNLIRTLWSSKTTMAAPTSQQESINKSRSLLCSQRVVEALCEMLKASGKFAVLLNEGLVALTLLAASTPTSSNSDQVDGTQFDEERAEMIASSLLAANGVSGRRGSAATEDTIVNNHSEAGSEANGSASFTAADMLYDLLTAASISINASSAHLSTAPTSSPSTAQAIQSGSHVKTFIPIQVAENGCALLRSLSGHAPSALVRQLSSQMLPALRGMKVRIGVIYGGRSGTVTSLSQEERDHSAASQKVIQATLQACEQASAQT
ncbi:unnamed protein product [Sympodiomycopsis kandeliae]